MKIIEFKGRTLTNPNSGNFTGSELDDTAETLPEQQISERIRQNNQRLVDQTINDFFEHVTQQPLARTSFAWNAALIIDLRIAVREVLERHQIVERCESHLIPDEAAAVPENQPTTDDDPMTLGELRVLLARDLQERPLRVLAELIALALVFVFILYGIPIMYEIVKNR